MLVLLAFWVPLCILPVYDLEPSSLGFFVFYCFIIYLLFTDQKKKIKKNNPVNEIQIQDRHDDSWHNLFMRILNYRADTSYRENTHIINQLFLSIILLPCTLPHRLLILA